MFHYVFLWNEIVISEHCLSPNKHSHNFHNLINIYYVYNLYHAIIQQIHKQFTSQFNLKSKANDRKTKQKLYIVLIRLYLVLVVLMLYRPCIHAQVFYGGIIIQSHSTNMDTGVFHGLPRTNTIILYLHFASLNFQRIIPWFSYFLLTIFYTFRCDFPTYI